MLLRQRNIDVATVVLFLRNSFMNISPDTTFRSAPKAKCGTHEPVALSMPKPMYGTTIAVEEAKVLSTALSIACAGKNNFFLEKFFEFPVQKSFSCTVSSPPTS